MCAVNYNGNWVHIHNYVCLHPVHAMDPKGTCRHIIHTLDGEPSELTGTSAISASHHACTTYMYMYVYTGSHKLYAYVYVDVNN